MANQKTIIGIAKSFKYDEYYMVKVLGEGKERMRKGYYQKSGKLKGLTIITIGSHKYSFNWNTETKTVEDLKYMGVHHSIEEAIFAATIDPEVKPEATPEVKPEATPIIFDENAEVKHEKFEQIKVCIKSNIPVYLAGPAGSGKNHTLEQIAKDLGLDFYFTNSVQQEFKLTGFIDAGGNYHETEFYKAFVNGGLFFLDEMDASIPEVLVLLNAAIANRYFEFPTGRVTAHKKFRVVAAGNTVGSGADEQYTGRLVLDQATLDRFAIIHFDYSIKIETHLAKGNMDLVTFVRDLRKQAQDKGVRATFSYRCITMVTKLEGKMSLRDILEIAVFKGFDKDTLNTFRPASSDKYSQTLRELIAS